jgi:adenylate cyclase
LIAKYATDSAYQVAEVYGARGEADLAFDWLERAYVQRDPGLADMKTNPRLRSLHADPRWIAFLRKMGFAD